MIITSRNGLDVGRAYTDRDALGRFEWFGETIDRYAFVVTRVASQADFEAYIRECHPTFINTIIPLNYFYEILTD